ncbi:MAG: cytidine deaminase [Crocinitomix sp.]|nr:cytidine deaminase [Crocinitomix sp.]
MQKKITIAYQEFTYDSIKDMDLKALIDETIQFADNAYAPYSKFHVGAGLRLETGEIIKGANMENASYPVSICAERNLLSHTVSNYPNQKITMLVVYVDKDLKVPVPPCGLCRQTLVEVEIRQEQPIQLIMVAKNGTIISLNSCKDLLPWAFDGSFLD